MRGGGALPPCPGPLAGLVPSAATSQAPSATIDTAASTASTRRGQPRFTEFDQVLEVEPNRADVLYLKGYCQYMLKEFSESVETFGKAFEADPLLDPRTIYRKAGASSGS